MRKFLRGLDPAAKRTLLTCFFAFFVNGLLSLMIGSILPDMKAAYHHLPHRFHPFQDCLYLFWQYELSLFQIYQNLCP